MAPKRGPPDGLAQKQRPAGRALGAAPARTPLLVAGSR